MGIFTHTSISPSPLLRQCPDRYAFRAGRNLPDKEFRYLRTVIVTAAVHRGFNSELRLRLPLLLTFRHWAGVSPYTSPCGFAETCVFVKQSPGPLHCDQLALVLLLPKLRSLFAEFLNKGSLVRLWLLTSSTGVGLRYGRQTSSLLGFSWGFLIPSPIGSIYRYGNLHPLSIAYAFRPRLRPDSPDAD